MSLFNKRSVTLINFDNEDTTPLDNEDTIKLPIVNNRQLNSFLASEVSNTPSTIETTEPKLVENKIDINNLHIRTLSVTFKSLYKNLATYDYSVDMSNKRFIIKSYTLENNKKIKVTIDMTVKHKIITTIEGDTGFPYKLVKKTIMQCNGSNKNRVTNLKITYETAEY